MPGRSADHSRSSTKLSPSSDYSRVKDLLSAHGMVVLVNQNCVLFWCYFLEKGRFSGSKTPGNDRMDRMGQDDRMTGWTGWQDGQVLEEPVPLEPQTPQITRAKGKECRVSFLTQE